MLKKLLKKTGDWFDREEKEFVGLLQKHTRNFLGINNAEKLQINCGDCGEINTVDSKFCGACGVCFVSKISLESGIKCQCGYLNAEGQAFCSECGASLGSEK